MAKVATRGEYAEPAHVNNLAVHSRGWGVFSGLAVSEKGAGADMSVDVGAGTVYIIGVDVVKGATTNVAITAAHATYTRYDLVVINSSGTISMVDGTPGNPSFANDYDFETNNAILLAMVEVPATDTSIEDAQITDFRLFRDALRVPTEVTGSRALNTDYLHNGKGLLLIHTTVDINSGVDISGNTVTVQAKTDGTATPSTVYSQISIKGNQGASDSLDTSSMVLPIIVKPGDYYAVDSALGTGGVATLKEWWETEI